MHAKKYLSRIIMLGQWLRIISFVFLYFIGSFSGHASENSGKTAAVSSKYQLLHAAF